MDDITTPRSPSSTKSSFPEHKLRDEAFKQAHGPSGDTGDGGEEEASKYPKPHTQSDSSSQHSLRSQKPSDRVSVGKINQPQSNSNSHKSNGSNGYSVHKSSANGHASHSDRSQSGLSGKSSISDIISDKADSVGSVRSRSSGQGRRVTVGQSGSDRSDRSEGRAYPGRETLEQIKTLVSLGGLSDIDSF